MARTLRVAVSPLRGGDQLLPEDAAHYVARVHRLTAGDALLLFDPRAGTEARASLLELSKKSVRVRVEAPREVPDLGRLPVCLVQALGKGEKPERVVKEATALGVSAIVLLESERGTPRVAQSDVRATQRRQRLEASAVDAARQSGRSRIPEIGGPLRFEDFLTQAGAHSLVLNPGGNVSLLDALEDTGQLPRPLQIWIGPEGGFSPEELTALEHRGARATRFGPLVLRTETAACAVLGALVAWFQR
ncbi:MAG: 16S rRNA (uracil(1498)-N(3))-methyltransferase [Myxococcales bacterium]|nr:16S rRNA (uracil(1498)-N(3))-methyltransferase [Myxococcales bacterium]